MRQTKFALTLLAAAVLAGCGGSSNVTDPAPKIKFASQVTFGDSLSDVGTYAVGSVKAVGGGKYTVNGPDGKNWTELVATQLGVSAPCAAETGLEGSAALGFSVAVATFADCTGYAQGGSRVTNPVGPGNKLTGSVLGQLTVPVVTQISNHLAAHGGKFSGTELVFVWAGHNDAFMQLGALTAAAKAAAAAAVTAAVPNQIAADIASGACVPTDAQASNCVAGAVATLTVTVGAPAAAAYTKANAQTYVDAMGTAGTELASYVNNMIVAKGAKYVAVISMADISQSPSAQAAIALDPSGNTLKLLNGMSVTFNARLIADITGKPNVLYIDEYTYGRAANANPASVGFTNTTSAACDPAKSILGDLSLTCTISSVIAGDVSHYEFADSTGHATPFGYSVVANFVTAELKKRGWL